MVRGRSFTGDEIMTAFGRWLVDAPNRPNYEDQEHEFYKFIEYTTGNTLLSRYGIVVLSVWLAGTSQEKVELLLSPHHHALVRAYYLQQDGRNG